MICLRMFKTKIRFANLKKKNKKKIINKKTLDYINRKYKERKKKHKFTSCEIEMKTCKKKLIL